MTLGQFATAVGATPRWVLNALTRLGVPRRYSEPRARRLALARFLSEDVGTPLPGAWRLAERILAEAEPTGTWREEGRGGIELRVDLPRFYSTYGPQLALARTEYGERVRGRRSMKRGTAVQRAKAYGIDVTLLDSALRRTPEQRMKAVAEDMRFLAALRKSVREGGGGAAR
jgi:hypothetical protein